MVSGDRDALRSLQQAVTRAVIPEGPPSTVLQRCSDRLIDSRLYSLAWIGRIDEGRDALVPVAATGVDLAHLTEVVVDAETDRPPRHPRHPAATAAARQEVRTDGTLPAVPAAVDDRPESDWLERARDLGCRSMAAVPLETDGQLEGVLYLATARRYAFDAAELGVLATVGETLAYAVNQRATATSDGTLLQGGSSGTDDSLSSPEDPPQEGTLAGEHRTLGRIVEALDDGIYAIDADSRFTMVNAAFCELTGYEREELVGEHASIVHSDAVDEWLTAGMTDTAAEGPAPEPIELTITTADGSAVPVETRISPFAFEDGSLGRVGVVHDVSERKRRERVLESHRAITEAASDAIVTIDEDGIVRSANPAVAELFGYEPEELVGEPLTLLMSDEQARAHEAGLGQYVETGERTFDWRRVELEGQHRDGDAVPLSISFSEFSVDGDHYFAGIIRDVTERVRYERALAGLHDATRDVIQAETAAAVAERVVAAATDVLDLEGVAIYRFDDAENELVPIAATDHVAELLGELSTFGPGDDGVTWEAFLAGETIVHEDVAESEGVRARDTPLRSGVWIPLGDRGVIAIVSEVVGGVDERRRQLADHLGATAEAALDRIAREERLRENERELAERNRHLEALDRTNSVLREIDQRLVAATTKADVEQSVCELLTRSERFAFAWIGGVEGDALVPRATEGDGRGYLDEVSLAISGAEAAGPTPTDDGDATELADDPAGAGDSEAAKDSDSTASLADPAVATAASDEVTVVDNVASALGSAPWRKAALSRDLQSAIAVPIRYGETRYGVLAVYAAETDAFDDLTRSVLAELGETIGNAIHAVETERALLTDSVVELDVAIAEAADPLVGLVEETGCSLTIDGIVPQAGSTRTFFTTIGADAEAALAAAQRSSRFEDVTLLDDGEAESHFEVTVDGAVIPSTLVECGAAVESVTISPEETRTVVELPHSIDVRTFVDRLEASYPQAELVARRDKERGDPANRGIESEIEAELTDRQLEALQTAYLSGYFEWPRERTGEEVAATLDITQSTFNGHLRAAERKLCALLFEHVQESV